MNTQSGAVGGHSQMRAPLITAHIVNKLRATYAGDVGAGVNPREPKSARRRARRTAPREQKGAPPDDRGVTSAARSDEERGRPKSARRRARRTAPREPKGAPPDDRGVTSAARSDEERGRPK